MEATRPTQSQCSSGMGESVDAGGVGTRTNESANATGAFRNVKFNGHRVSVARYAMKVMESIGDNCPICIEPMVASGSNFSLPLTVLPCYHLYHEHCIRSALERRQKCSICQTPVSPSVLGGNTFTDKIKLADNLPLECSGNGCLVNDAQQVENFKCPYPASTFSLGQPGQFVQENSGHLIQWLKNFFASQGYPDCRAGYIENQPDKQNHIALSVTTSPNRQPQLLYYHCAEINSGQSVEECFDILMKDALTDKLFLDLKKSRPAYFLQDTKLFIKGWSLYENKVYFSGSSLIGLDFVIDLDRVIDPSGDKVNTELMKGELARLRADLNPNELASDAPAEGTLRFCNRGGGRTVLFSLP
ncbi:RING finger domain-containing protein [Endozoicomonas euniceicola]|uniref:RING-type domain-containing protein n=1 Tax=Endozoicomonas euniceicola TaxID=1234143 RepID=A0ABY6GZG6_9GAMM|nr:RING finger domain-containing protein [Endozoicomonas euniceicola]UYM18203.1 hypothetical protein NX720_09950 [Endozoicomonas euniceicola]